MNQYLNHNLKQLKDKTISASEEKNKRDQRRYRGYRETRTSTAANAENNKYNRTNNNTSSTSTNVIKNGNTTTFTSNPVYARHRKK